MRDNLSPTENMIAWILAVIVALVLFVGYVALKATVLYFVWSWAIVPVLRAPEISFAQMYWITLGLMILFEQINIRKE